MNPSIAGELSRIGADRRDLLGQLHRMDADPPASPSIMVACVPKSGSTFVSRVFAEATEMERREFLYDINGHNGWDLYLPQLMAAAQQSPQRGYVSHHHVLATPPNLELIKIFNFRTVVLLRNVFDVIVSLRDHALAVRDDPRVVAITPLHVPDRFCDLDSETQFDWIIDFRIPWYIRFFVGWYKVHWSRAIDCLWATYDELMAEPVSQLTRILEQLGFPQPADRVERAIITANADRGAIRFNKGVTGRGSQLLSDEQKARVIALTRYYPDINFASLGITQSIRDQVA